MALGGTNAPEKASNTYLNTVKQIRGPGGSSGPRQITPGGSVRPRVAWAAIW